MLKKISYIVTFFLLLGNTQVYNSNKCDRVFRRFGGFAGSVYSTSSYFSSTGDCAMIGQIEHDQKLFLAINLDQVKLDSARGGGEYLDSYAQLGKLASEEKLMLFRFIQKNYAFVFKNNDIEAIYWRIRIIKS